MAAPPAKRPRVVENGEKIPILGRDDVLSRLEAFRKDKCAPIGAMYSSVVGGIVTDPVLMTVPIDDHMIVRGHAIFEAHGVVNGRLYRLDQHLDRLFRSAKSARVPLPFGDDEETNRHKIVSIVSQVVVTSGLRNAGVRLYLSVGPGDFDIMPTNCTTAFYVVVKASDHVWEHELQGIPEVSVDVATVPIKPPLLARTKTNNYLLNSLTAMVAKDKGGVHGIGVDDKGYVTESAISNVSFITTDRRFVTPKFDNILAGTTVKKLMQCAEKLVADGDLKSVSQEDVLASEAKTWPEVLRSGGDTHVWAVTSWDGKPVGNGQVGEITKKLVALLQEHAESENNPDDHYILTYP